MKCDVCNGTGKRYIDEYSDYGHKLLEKICYNCNGSGKIENRHGYSVECPFCNGSGKIRKLAQTNEEWLRTASTDELADTLYRLCNHASIFGGSTKEEFKVWLKETYRNEHNKRNRA